MPQSSFDVVFHLIGGQSLPNAFAIHAIPAERHILFATDKTEVVAQRLLNAFADKQLEVVHCVDPYDIPSLQALFTEYLHRFAGQRLAANITGATKTMALMLTHVAEQIGQIPLYYMETVPKALKIEIWPNADKWTATTSILETDIKSVREYISLYSDALFDPGEKTCDAQSIALARTIAACPSIRKSLSFKLSKFVDCLPNAQYAFYESKFDVTLDDFDRDLDKHTWDTNARKACRAGIQNMIATAGKEATCRFLGGIWLEIFAFSELQGREGFFDVQQSAHVKFKRNEYDRQEFDVVTCTKHHVYIVECKSGRVTSEQIANLTANVAQYAGTFGRGILVTTSECMGYTCDREAYENLKTRIRESDNIMLVELPKKMPPNFLANALRAWKAGVYAPLDQGASPAKR